jgi:redox-sensing transcriptional repressor
MGIQHQDGTPMSKEAKIPNPTIKRLAVYSRPLEILLETGPPVISSQNLAGLCGVNPAQVRKDLAYFGEFGIRGVGYDIRDLLHAIKGILATDRQWSLCIVGMGHLGSSLVQSENFRKRGYIVKAAFDSDARKTGKKLSCGLTIQAASTISKAVQALDIEIGLITTPPHEAQRVAHLLQEGGVGAILNFTTVQIRTRKKCIIENADLSVKFENLVYHLEQLDKM